MSSIFSTLFYPWVSQILSVSSTDKILFLNAQFCPELSLFPRLDVHQYFKPYAQILEVRGYGVTGFENIEQGGYDVVCVHSPKNNIEAQYLIAFGLQALKKDGLFVCAADNKAGSGRLEKWLQNFGVSDIQSHSKNKARVVWGAKESLEKDVVESAVQGGLAQNMEHGFISQAGIYGWNKVDKGSKILTDHLPVDLKGKGADFGCGYGYLTKHVLQSCPKISQWACLDADQRAVQICEVNCEALAGAAGVSYQWQDLTAPVSSLKNLDVIVMNPPFHEGKKVDLAIGRGFIQSAYEALRRGGVLYMVANAHLSYEQILSDLFFKVDKVHEGSGFKVFCATR